MISIELKQLVDPNNEACCEYHLAHKVKEWALKQGYRIASQLIERGITIDIGMNGFAVVHTCNREVNKEREDTELEAVFAAGEWVLNQQNKGM